MAELVWDAIHEAAENMDGWKRAGGAPDEKPDGLIQAIEAGTGIGKSLGYLIPSIAARRHPVMIATRTKQLQRQLMDDDLPRAKGILGQEINAVLAKGRSNYLCLTSWGLAQVRPPAEMQKSDFGLWQALPKWAETTETGDREELGRYAEGDSELWNQLNARAEKCIGSACPNKSECFLTKLKQGLAQADLIIVNHALLLADRVMREDSAGSVLPDAPVLVLDEAHDIEDQLTESCAEQWSSRAMTMLFNDLKDMANKDADGAAVSAHLPPWEDAWRSLMALIPKENNSVGFDDPRLDFGPLADAVAAWADAGQAVFSEVKRLSERGRSAEEDNAMDNALWRTLMGRIGQAFKRMELIFAQPEGWVSTLAREGPQIVSFKANPVDVKKFFHRCLRRGFEALIMTSATLRDGSGFNGLKLRLGFTEEEAERGVLVDSPFDFENQGMLFVPPGIPEREAGRGGVGEPAWVDASLGAMTRLLAASKGRALILFTSRKMLAEFKTRLKESLPYITLFVQGEALSRSQLLDRFRQTPNSALLGLASFWQGIDLPGEALSLVIVAALPFAPPDDPVIQARIREADAIRPGLGFVGIQVPQMTLKLKQGIGRLIRARTDRGVVCILDPRLMLPNEDHLGKRYASQVRAALPPFPITRDWEKVEMFLEGL
jgi:ATP-dependent DNA helicase DinG